MSVFRSCNHADNGVFIYKNVPINNQCLWVRLKTGRGGDVYRIQSYVIKYVSDDIRQNSD